MQSGRYNVNLPNSRVLRVVLPETATAGDILTAVREKCASSSATWTTGFDSSMLNTVLVRRAGVPLDIQNDPIIDENDILQEVVGPNEILCALNLPRVQTPEPDYLNVNDYEVEDEEETKTPPFETSIQTNNFLTVDEVNNRLIKFGITILPYMPRCARAAIARGHIKLETAEDLDKDVYTGPCDVCGETIHVTLRQALHQSDHGGDYEDGSEGGAIKCQECGEYAAYLSYMCDGAFAPDCGKGHNHCDECDGFGICSGDYRNQHCFVCGDHYFAGFMGNFECQNCEVQKMNNSPLGQMLNNVDNEDDRASMMFYLMTTGAFGPRANDFDDPEHW